ncbi:hypothetical protein [Treponema bryantii]|uniref:hypothetical protein n=1 Tax=Treponema bryantii TaxID=163 RepID=UPI002B2971BD|nr:hypothetical protein TRBR_27660 [Treponema bryantii]
MDFCKLFQCVELFHNAIVEIKNELSIEFHNFPAGSCGTTCILLATFLNENGFEKIKMIIGGKEFFTENSYQEYSHAWLELNKILVIDITAYQFPEIQEKIFIHKNSLWHKGWKVLEEIKDPNIYTSIATTNSDFINYSKIKEKILRKENT